MKIKPFARTFGTTITLEAGESVLDLDRDKINHLFAESGSIFWESPQTDMDTFARFTDMYGRDFMNYQGGAFRWRSLDRESVENNPTVLTVTGASQDFPIPVHGEMYYQKQKPAVLWFYCETPPPKDGETTVCDGIEVYRALSPSTRELLGTKQLKYIRELAAADWQVMFQTEDLGEVERACARSETKLIFNPENRSIKTEYYCSAIVKWQGQDVFLNNILPVMMGESVLKNDVPLKVRLEDDSPIPPDILAELERVVDELTVPIKWQKGYIFMVDNTRILHGRRSGSGKERKIYVRMAENLLSGRN